MKKCLALTLLCLAFAVAPAGAQTQSDQTIAAALMTRIQSCFLPPSSAAMNTVILFEVDAAGNVLGTPRPEIKDRSVAQRQFDAAAIRAIQRCGPYETGGVKEIRARFDTHSMFR